MTIAILPVRFSRDARNLASAMFGGVLVGRLRLKYDTKADNHCERLSLWGNSPPHLKVCREG